MNVNNPRRVKHHGFKKQKKQNKNRLRKILAHCYQREQYQVGRKCVQMLRVSLVSWKRLRMQSLAELQGCRYPEMMLSSWKTCKTG